MNFVWKLKNWTNHISQTDCPKANEITSKCTHHSKIELRICVTKYFAASFYVASLKHTKRLFRAVSCDYCSLQFIFGFTSTYFVFYPPRTLSLTNGTLFCLVVCGFCIMSARSRNMKRCIRVDASVICVLSFDISKKNFSCNFTLPTLLWLSGSC